MSGSAIYGADFTLTGASYNTTTGIGTVTFPAGVNDVSVDYNVINDGVFGESREATTFTLLPSDGSTNAYYNLTGFTPHRATTFEITGPGATLPTFGVEKISDARELWEASPALGVRADGVFRIYRDTSGAEAVHNILVTATGNGSLSAADGSSSPVLLHASVPSQHYINVRFLAGQNYADVYYIPANDLDADTGESFTLSIETWNNNYIVDPSRIAASMQVADSDSLRDIEMQKLFAEAGQLKVAYRVHGGEVAPFKIGVYRSASGSTTDVLLTSITVSSAADRAAGDHVLVIPATFADPGANYLLGVLDYEGVVTEFYESGNRGVFTGGAFLAADNTVRVYRDTGEDTVSVTTDGTQLHVSVDLSEPPPYWDVNGDGLASQADVTAVQNILELRATKQWMNPNNPYDVDNNGYIQPLDTLLINNRLNGQGPGTLTGQPGAGDYFVDANGDGMVTALDSVTITNYLNSVPGKVWQKDHNPWDVTGNGTLDESDVVAAFRAIPQDATTSFALSQVTGIHIHTFGGNDAITLEAGLTLPATIYAGIGDDHVVGGAGADLIDGGMGNDLLQGRGGSDTLVGGAGNDVLFGGDAIDHLFADDGTDWLYGEGGNDALHLADASDNFDDPFGINDVFDNGMQAAYGGVYNYNDPDDENLLINGGFEGYEVTHSGGWNLFTSLPGWTLSGASAGFKVREGIAASGDQYLEFDSDIDGPDASSGAGWSSSAQEATATVFHQQVATLVGQTYTFSFAMAQRAGTLAADNAIGFELRDAATGALLLGDIVTPGSTSWETLTRTFTAAGNATLVKFIYQGTPDNEGGLLDEVYVSENPPVANYDHYTTGINTTLVREVEQGVLKNDVRANDKAWSARVIMPPAHGDLTFNANGSFTYVPHTNFVGSDGFTYIVNNTQQDSNVGTVDLQVIQPVVNLKADSNNDGHIDGNDDAIELQNPGFAIPYNGDDDNGNGTVDAFDGPSWTVADSELKLVEIGEIESYGLDMQGYTLHIETAGSAIKVWKDQSRTPLASWYRVDLEAPPTHFYVEGIEWTESAQIHLVLKNAVGGEVARDSVRVTSLHVNITAKRPKSSIILDADVPPGVETTTGVGIRRNGDDDNDNGVADRLDTTAVNDDDLVFMQLIGSSEVGLRHELTRSNSHVVLWTNPDKSTKLDFGAGNTIDLGAFTGLTVWAEWTDMAATAVSTTLVLAAIDDRFDRPLYLDTVVLKPINSIVIILGGETQVPADPVTNQGEHGTFELGIELHKLHGYDVYLYDEDAQDQDGLGDAYDEIVSAVMERGVTEVAMVGYSHGGGRLLHLAARLEMNANGTLADTSVPFVVRVTAYIDGIESDHRFDNDPEKRRPPLAELHINQYQQNSILANGTGGTTVGPVDIDLNQSSLQLNGVLVDHDTIEDHPDVTNLIIECIELRVQR